MTWNLLANCRRREPFSCAIRTAGILLALFFTNIATVMAGPKLEWEAQRIDLRATPEMEEVTAAFRFKNVGDSTIKLTNLRVSCGCTVATLQKEEYAPGEAGAVKVVFTIGSRLGEEEKLIQVDTNDEKQPKAYLKLHVSIPPAVTLNPRSLSWDKTEPLVPKKVRATVLADAPINRLMATSSDKTLDIEVEKVAGTEKEYDITVSPKGSDRMTRAVVTVSTDWPLQKPKKFSIYIFVR